VGYWASGAHLKSDWRAGVPQHFVKRGLRLIEGYQSEKEDSELKLGKTASNVLSNHLALLFFERIRLVG